MDAGVAFLTMTFHLSCDIPAVYIELSRVPVVV